MCDRKHRLALTALDRAGCRAGPLRQDLDEWTTGALHIALQVQRAHQALKKPKGSTFLVFDEHHNASKLAELLFEPPEWTDGYYDRKTKDPRLDQVVDTAFYARSHHAGLVQVADLFAFIFCRYAELLDYGRDEAFKGEVDLISSWTTKLSNRLLPLAHRWRKGTSDATAAWYTARAPSSLLGLSR